MDQNQDLQAVAQVQQEEEEEEAAAAAEAPAPKQPEERRDEAGDADATEADVSEVVLDQQDVDEDPEKRPMTGDAQAEKNGCVKLNVDDDGGEFTGLKKDELLRVAGTPGWVRTRWALLVLFWLGWLAMLAGATLLILRAPRCRELPATRWWNRGALYRVPSVRAFSDAGDIRGVREKVDALSQLRLSGLVLGPVHVAPPDDAAALSFQEIAAEAGSLEQFRELLGAAHRKGICVVLDLTPNYRGSSGSWFSDASVTVVAEKLKSALVFWFSEGVDGVQLADVDYAAAAVPSLWADIRAIVQNGTNERPTRRSE